MPDINLLSFNGPADNGRVVDLADQNFDGSGGVIADTLKFSTGLSNFRGSFGEVTSGKEDAFDFNNLCAGVSVTAKKIILQGSMGITIKGGCRDIGVTCFDVVGRGKETDVDLGNWSDQSHDYVQRVSLNLRRRDGSPIYVRMIASDQPSLVPGSGPYVFVFPQPNIPRWLVVPMFNQLRRSGLFR